MAVLTAKGIARTAIPLLLRTLVLARTVSIVSSDEFAGPNGETKTVRVPQPGAARIQTSRGAQLTADDTVEVPVDVSMSHIYHLKNLTDQEATFDLESFARQVTPVQVGAVATGAEDQLAGAMNALDADADNITESVSAVKDALKGARAFLSRRNVPAGDRWIACSPEFANIVLELLTDRETPNTDSALREALLGRVLGANAFESNGLDAGTAVFYHRSGFVWANRQPNIARGAAEAFGLSNQGVALRQVFQYNPNNAQDQSLLSTFAGAAPVIDWDGVTLDQEDEPDFTEGAEVRRFYKLALEGSDADTDADTDDDDAS